ncbi:hypothetical protein RUM43_000458 [Polyplax serrata]|uniref:Uncharacterized protein n=1 Tax=Polyplax serrata TaxID=468196 RepID=A0AAN8SG05_POLSC
MKRQRESSMRWLSSKDKEEFCYVGYLPSHTRLHIDGLTFKKNKLPGKNIPGPLLGSLDPSTVKQPAILFVEVYLLASQRFLFGKMGLFFFLEENVLVFQTKPFEIAAALSKGVQASVQSRGRLSVFVAFLRDHLIVDICLV